MRDALGEEAWRTLRPHVEVALSGKVASYEAEVPYLDGGTRWIFATYTPDLDERGVVRGLVAHVNDITPHKRVEAALQESEVQLRERAAQLAEADRRKDEFLAVLSHELRNPLAPIRNGLEAMRLSSGDVAAMEQARSMMERQLGHLVHLVDDLLDVSRITHGKVQLRRERAELAAIVDIAVESSRVAVEEGDHALTISLPPEPVYVDADVTRLAQVFANLLNNAARYTPRGGQISLRAERRNESMVVTVTDTGIGIPAEALPRVFDMFSQVDRSVEKAAGGLGIGLALVKALVEMHGGTVEASSAGQGQGSEFFVTLPVAPDGPAQVRSQRGVQRSSGKQRILVADDNHDSADSLAMLLRISGHEVHTCYDGLEGLEAVVRLRPEVVLLDIGMPKLNGHEVCRQIRAQPWGRTVTVIAVTGWGDEQTRSRAKEAGFDRHLTKPVDYSALTELLTRLRATL